jgi:hypothetical protein
MAAFLSPADAHSREHRPVLHGKNENSGREPTRDGSYELGIRLGSRAASSTGERRRLNSARAVSGKGKGRRPASDPIEVAIPARALQQRDFARRQASPVADPAVTLRTAQRPHAENQGREGRVS